MTDRRIFKASEIDVYAKGWIADLSPASVVNPDYYWPWRTKRQAERFIALVDSGIDADIAAYQVNEVTATAAALGTLGGQASTDAKAAAARENGKRGGRPMSWSTAARIMADENSTHEERERAASRMCVELGRPDDTGLYDWLREGTWTGSETLEQVRQELEELESA
jgi:hypothetical protein